MEFNTEAEPEDDVKTTAVSMALGKREHTKILKRCRTVWEHFSHFLLLLS